MRFYFAIALAIPICAITDAPAFCQTVGNGTVFASPAGARESYGINATPENAISYPTRHTSGGNGSGIGTSFIGTTSPTSESSPAVSRPAFVADTVQQFHLPKLDSYYSGDPTSPALRTFSPLLPKLPRTSALTDTWTNPFTRPNTFQPIEELPSFSRKRSVTDLMRF